MMSENGVKRALPLVFLILIFLTPVTANALEGTVTDQQGAPISGSTVVLVKGLSELARITTGSDGSFSADVQGDNISVFVYADLPATPGVDYVPFYTVANGQDNLDIVLLPGSSILIDGNIQYVDTENIALKTTYGVEGENNRTLNPSGVSLKYRCTY
jgi:hypothetical protein